MKRKYFAYAAVPATIALFFFDKPFAMAPALIVAVLYAKIVYRLTRNIFSRSKSKYNIQSTAEGNEKTVNTLVAINPNRVLGIEEEAGTATIFRSFYQKVKEEQSDGLRLSKQGRRLTAAKNEMLLRRRKSGASVLAESRSAEKDLKNSLQSLLERRPVYEGNVIQFANLSAAIMEKCVVGAEIDDLGLTGFCAEPEQVSGRGTCRLVISCATGRLLDKGRVAFLPGTRFLIKSRTIWQNPKHPELPTGYSYELVELIRKTA